MKRPRQSRDWNDLAQMDPMWAVLSEAEKQNGTWNVEEFFRTGVDEVKELRAVMATLGFNGNPQCALDFGCGLGRLTVALNEFCSETIGIDISSDMVEVARSLHPDHQFRHNPNSDLRIFPSSYFDLIYSRRVLQHESSATAILHYVYEFMRILKPGGFAAFQIPSRIPLRHRMQPRRRLYSVLRNLGVSPQLLYRYKIHPMRMTAVPEAAVCSALKNAGARILRVVPDDSCPGNESRFYYVSR